MKIQKLIDSFNMLKNTNITDGSVKFKFLFVKNLKTIEEEVSKIQESLQKILEPDPKFIEFDQNRLEIIKKYADLDKNGNIKQDVRGNAIIPDDKRPEFQKEVDKLLEDYKEVVEQRNKQLQEYNELLQEEFDISELKLTKIKLDLVPDSISMKVLEAMYEFNMIDEG